LSPDFRAKLEANTAFSSDLAFQILNITCRLYQF
jgi:hypothetical protein